MSEKRKVRIETLGDTFFVRYVERRKGQRYSAAQFNMKQWGFDDVVRWVSCDPKLELVTNPKETKAHALIAVADTLREDFNIKTTEVRDQRVYFKFNGIEMAVILNPN